MSTAKMNIPNKSTKQTTPANRANAPRKINLEEQMCAKSIAKQKPKEYITAIDVDGMRRVIVPDRNPIDIPGIFPKSEFKRLKNQAHIVTRKDRMAMLEEAERQKADLQAQSQKRKEALVRAQREQHAKLGTKLNDVERDAKTKNMYLLQRSHDLLQEQDNRVKAANGVILATKCRAIRNAQIAEKELIEKQLQEEERRLDMMMEQQRQKALEAEQKRREEEERKKQRYVKELSEQMRLNEIERMIEAEKIEEESKMVNKAFLAVQREEQEKLREKKEMQQKVRDDLQKANMDMERYRLVQQEEQRIADLRIQKFMEQKLQREIAREQDAALAKQAKEQEIARMRAQQEKSQDHRAAMDEMNALRIQEEVERKWRQKQIADAKLKKQRDDALKRDREKQIEDIRKLAAIRMARDEQDFHRVAKVQRELFEKDMEKKRKKREEAEKHRKELLQQINEKERERITQQKERFEEGKMQMLEQQRKDQHVHEHLEKKISQLREHNIPEQYIQEIEGHINSIITNK